MKLGAFSVSLSVKDIKASLAFYEKMGFAKLGGNIEENWIILKNDDCIIGLFQGMFEGNILTFNPGWDANANELERFTDIRDIQREILDKGIKLIDMAEQNTSGPASLTLKDPDGNSILIDQHV